MIAMSNFEEFAQAVGRDVKTLNQKPEPRLTLTGNTLGIVGGNHVTLPLPDNVGHEIRGTGSPEGRITAEIGTTYVDVNVTNGALKWIKTTDDGNTGWKVIHGDTGWVLVWSGKANDDVINRMYFRRINDTVHVKFNPENIHEDYYSGTNLSLYRGTSDYDEKLSIQGFQPVSDIVQTIFNVSNEIYVGTAGAENSEESRGTGVVILEEQYTDYKYYYRHKFFNLKIVTSELGVENNHVNPFSYLTEDEWPTELPTIGG